MAYGNYAPFYRGGFFNPMQTPTMPPMADNQNQFAQPYQPPIQQPTQQITPPTAPTQTPQMSNDMIWVQGLAGAKAYLVAPNTTVTLWDSESETIYLKSCDSNGVPSMRILDIKERIETPSKLPSKEVEQPTKDFALAEDLKGVQEKFAHKYEKLEGLYEKLSEKVDKLAVKPTPKTTKKTESE